VVEDLQGTLQIEPSALGRPERMRLSSSTGYWRTSSSEMWASSAGSSRPTPVLSKAWTARRRRRSVLSSRIRPRRGIILTTFELDEYVYEALRAGASGFLVKDTEPAELLRGVRVVAGGDALLSPGVTRRLIAEFAAQARPPRPSAALDALTNRERR
jgi:hypothetical protein